MIQFATMEHAFIVQISSTISIDFLKNMIESPEIVKIGFGLKSDRGPLRQKLGIRLGSVSRSCSCGTQVRVSPSCWRQICCSHSFGSESAEIQIDNNIQLGAPKASPKPTALRCKRCVCCIDGLSCYRQAIHPAVIKSNLTGRKPINLKQPVY